MPSLQVLYQPRAAMLLLIACLILETAHGRTIWRKRLSLNMKISPTNNANQFKVKLTVTNNENKCMAVRASTKDNSYITYLSIHATYTSCVCATDNFFWKIKVSKRTFLQGKVEVVPPKGICPGGDKIDRITYTYTGSITQEIPVTQ